jgi:hypothetical protein
MIIIIINFPQPNSIHGGGLSKSLVIKEEPNFVTRKQEASTNNY